MNRRKILKSAVGAVGGLFGVKAAAGKEVQTFNFTPEGPIIDADKLKKYAKLAQSYEDLRVIISCDKRSINYVEPNKTKNLEIRLNGEKTDCGWSFVDEIKGVGIKWDDGKDVLVNGKFEFVGLSDDERRAIKHSVLDRDKLKVENAALHEDIKIFELRLNNKIAKIDQLKTDNAFLKNQIEHLTSGHSSVNRGYEETKSGTVETVCWTDHVGNNHRRVKVGDLSTYRINGIVQIS